MRREGLVFGLACLLLSVAPISIGAKIGWLIWYNGYPVFHLMDVFGLVAAGAVLLYVGLSLICKSCHGVIRKE